MKRASVFVSEVGVISPLGNSWSEFETNMFAGRSGIRAIRGTQVAKDFPVPYAGVVEDRNLPTDLDLGFKTPFATNSARYSLLSAMQCLETVSAKHKIDSLVYGTAGGIYFDLVVDSMKGLDKNYPWDRTRAEYGAHLLNDIIEERQGARVQRQNMMTMNSACASGNHAIGMALQFIQSGRWNRALVTLVDSGAWSSQIMNFYLLHALSTVDVPPEKASCPFSKRRAGFVKSEASVSLLLESESAVRERGGQPLAEVKGFGLTSDAYRMTDGREDGLCVGRAMELAVKNSGLQLTDVDYINAHGTSTPLNDRLETAAVKNVFGQRAYEIPMSSLKSQLGHSTVAAGGLEAIACVSMLREQKLAPTINYEEADPECDLDYVPNVSRAMKVDNILSNNLGFGGQNASLVFGRVK